MRRITISIFALIMLISSSFGSVATAQEVTPMASETLDKYTVGLTATRSKEITVNYSVTASQRADSVGVSSIKIYKSGGTLVTTITGTTGNGLIATSTRNHAGSYSYIGTSGVSYYAEVTVFATIGSVTDSRTVTTAPKTAL